MFDAGCRGECRVPKLGALPVNKLTLLITKAFLPLLILGYELLPGRRTRSGSDDDEETPDDIGMTIVDAFRAWFTESKASLFMSIIMLTVGTYLVSSRDLGSTFFCSNQDRRIVVVLFQWIGLVLDATIAILLWRILAWARSTKSRLRTLSGMLMAAALGTGLLYRVSRFFLPSTPIAYQFRGLDSLYIFDVVVDGFAFSTFIIATSLLATEGSPLSLAGIITFLFGLAQAIQLTAVTGSWENISPGVVYVGLILVCVGFSFFVYSNNIESVVFMHRAFVVILLVIITIVATIYIPIKALQVTDKHPLIRTIYDARTAADRWLVRATVSDSLPVAVQEYKDRHNGRDPPPNFDVWYDFATQRGSVVIDHFAQMEEDILPFWGVPPSKVREAARHAAAEPDMALLRIQGGKIEHNLPPSSPYKPIIDDLIELIRGFVQHLSDMELAVNLNERPRVLAPWDDVQRAVKTASWKRVSKLLPRSVDAHGEMPAARSPSNEGSPVEEYFTPVKALREMTALTCPPGARGRAGTHWDVRDICVSCARPQSQQQYLANWQLSQDICHQSDLFRLHSFHMTPPEVRPLQELLPVFSRAKTDSYSDILIPLHRISEPAEPTTEGFEMKFKRLFWRGKVDRHGISHELVRGGHQERLVHSLNNPARSEKTVILLPQKKTLGYEQVSTADINELFPIDVAFSEYNACKNTAASQTGNDGTCNKDAATEFHRKSEGEEALRHKYVMVIDTDNGPSHEVLRTLRSNSVPFYASIFKEWYSERLIPWIHFVPVDLRFHALHSTVVYFMGLQKRDGRMLNGREVEMEDRQDDGKWIAEQGKRWAEKAIRREDMEVYLFRLLLEWGRIVAENRDEIGFELKKGN